MKIRSREIHFWTFFYNLLHNSVSFRSPSKRLFENVQVHKFIIFMPIQGNYYQCLHTLFALSFSFVLYLSLCNPFAIVLNVTRVYQNALEH